MENTEDCEGAFSFKEIKDAINDSTNKDIKRIINYFEDIVDSINSSLDSDDVFKTRTKCN